MKFTIAPTKLTSTPSPVGWVLFHDFTPINKDLFNAKGRLMTIIHLIAKNGSFLPPGQEIIQGREALKLLHEEYFASKSDPLQSLTSAIHKVNQAFSTKNEELHIAATAIINEKIFLSKVGEVESWILRDTKLAQILSNTIPQSAGFIQNNDLIFLGTSSFFAKITPDLLKTQINFADIFAKSEKIMALAILKVSAIEDHSQKLPIPDSPKLFIPPAKTISPFRRTLANLIDRILIHLPQRNLVIKEEIGEIENKKRKKLASTLGGALLVILIISIIFGLRQQKITNSRSQYDDVIVSIEHNLSEAQSLVSINPARARKLILDAKDSLTSLKNQKIKDERLVKLGENVENAVGSIAGIYQGEPSLYLDLSLLSSGMKGDDLGASDGRMAVLDKNGKKLVSIEIDTKKTQVAAGPDIMPDAQSIAIYSDRNFVTAQDGIWEVGDKANIVIKSDWGKNILPFAYTGNFYVLDKDNGAVWRYQGDGGTFSTKENWFGAGIKPDLENVISWIIDGNIWMLTTNGEVLRFSQGSPINFSIKDPDKDLKANAIYTDGDSKYLYILDAGNSRVLVIDKDGNYKAQYWADEIKNTKKIVVSEENKKIILLDQDKLYSLDIKHL